MSTNWLSRPLCILSLAPFVVPSLPAPQSAKHHARIMIVGITHLVAKQDLHNFDLGDPMSSKMQTQISEAMHRLLKFSPTKVMIEAEYSNAKIRQDYKRYLAAQFQLGPNENYQYGFRLAALAKNKEIYPVDAQNFPFDYEKVDAFAKSHGQQAILERADQEAFAPLQKGIDASIRTGSLINILRYLNTPEALRANEAWYLVVDGIGNNADYPGAGLVSSWWARNLHIFANILRSIDSQDDRIVLFIGQGHAALLRHFVENSPDLELVDPIPYLEHDLPREAAAPSDKHSVPNMD